jgi:hypothetical protein
VNSNFLQGAAYVFVKPGSGWAGATQTAKLTASDGAALNVLGSSVAISGNTIAAGAASLAESFSPQAVYVFVRHGSQWTNATQTAKLTASDGAPGDGFGSSVAISGDTLVAGANFATVGANARQGAAYVFVAPGSGWANATQTAKLTASDGAAFDNFGLSVGISGDTVVVGANLATEAANTDQGSLYVFVKGSSWAKATQTKLTASDGASVDRLGSSVAISGNTIAAGAPGATVNANFLQGAAYVFANSGLG